MSKIIKILIALAVVIIIISSFRQSKSDNSLKIGVIAPLTGIVADYGEEIRKGVQDVASSTKVTFIFEDDKCEAKDAVTAFKKLTELDKVNYIIGPACGSPQEAVIPLIKDKGVITIVPSAASKGLFDSSGGNFFNIQYSLEGESQFIAEKFNSLGYKKVSLVYYKNAFSEAHAESFKKNFNGEIVETIFAENTSDIVPELPKIKAAKVDAIYSPDISFFFSSGLVKLRQLGVGAPIYSTYVSELPAVREFVPNVYYSFPDNIRGSNGAVFELSKQAASILSGYVENCNGRGDCVKNMITTSKDFDDHGIFKRGFVLKQIVGTTTRNIK